jgi:hypothetical protein
MSPADRSHGCHGKVRPDIHMEHPFLAHLIPILSIYELGLPRAPIPPYDGPSTWQTDYILRALKTITNRMYTAEHSLACTLILRIVKAWATFRSLPTPWLNRLKAAYPLPIHSLLLTLQLPQRVSRHPVPLSLSLPVHPVLLHLKLTRTQ